MNWKILALGIPLAAALVACPPPPATPSYTLAIDPASLTFDKPTTTAKVVTLTITPKDGFSSDLTATLVIPSGSTGITATDVTIPAGATTAQLSVVITSAATEGANQAFVVQTSGGGLDPQTQALSITVNKAGTPPPPPTPNFAVSATAPAAVAKPSSGTVPTASTVTVTPSNGFVGSVVVTAAPAVTGVTYSPLTITIPAGGTSAVTGTLTANVSNTATAGTTAVTVTGTSTIAGASAARTAPAVNLVINSASAPVLDHITVTGTASLNLNTPTLFTAVGFDASNVALPTQPTFTWTPTTSATGVTADSTGKVTATKFITAPVTITATSGTKSGTFSVTSTYGMEASVGTYQIMDSSGGVSLGTAFLIRMRDAAGNIVSGNNATTFKIAGPATWNGGAVADAIGNGDFLWGALDAFAWLRTPPASTATASAPVNGTYTITNPITAAVTYTGKAQLVNSADVLPMPVFTTPEVTGTGASRTANIAWSAVIGATSYRVQVLRTTACTPVPPATTCTGTSTTVDYTNNQVELSATTSVTYATGDTYKFRVIAYPVNVKAADVTLPTQQFNISSTDVNATITGI